jgi:hypothetical protein
MKLYYLQENYLETIMLSEINQTQKDKPCMLTLICRIWKKIHDSRRRTIGDEEEDQREWERSRTRQ